MTLYELLKEKEMTQYFLAKNSGVPYSTINEICNGKTNLKNCKGETLYKISKILKISIEELIELDERIDFDLFKSNSCHRLRALGDIDYVIEILQSNDIQTYYEKKWYPECLYLLAMLDYLSNKNNIPLCTNYNKLRMTKLEQTIYPSSLVVESKIMNDPSMLTKAVKESIPEFIRFNIVEKELYNVV